MNELDLQDKYLINFFSERQDGLQHKEAKANISEAEQRRRSHCQTD
jgi:type I restriction enzyme, R subunit